MKNAIILHGKPGKDEYYSEQYPSASNSHWLPWLQKKLLINNIAAETPEVPQAYEPIWERWLKEIEHYDINPKTILVGHSCGAGFWVRYLSERKELYIDRVILVAPWIDADQEDPNHFFDFTIDTDLVSRTKKLVIFCSNNDGIKIQKSVTKLRNEIKDVTVREFETKGHFTHESMPNNKFPELLEELL
ncbi:MAG: alpha/beta hydrolase [Candidatus Saccharibacteria bacterium]